MGVPALSPGDARRVNPRPRGLADLDDLQSVFNALAHQSRRTILSVLHARGGEMSSGAIASRFDCSWPTTTRHLRVLEDAGLVHVALRGREHVYRLDIARLRTVAGTWLNRFGAGAPLL
jgi:DNA-binding transcriptional ArsR family regulator